jgi:SAM-dependent methyltransferase
METFESRDRRRLYSDLAWLWPIISPPEDYVAETKEVIDLIQDYSQIPVTHLLNIGCGGGHNDFTLKEHFTVTGVDISEDMLALARTLNPEIAYYVGDMRSIRLGAQFEAVTIFDSINYMRTIEGLRAAFTTAFSHLQPGGVFVTCIEEWAERFVQNKTCHTVGKRDDIEIALVENYYDPDPNDTWYEGNFVYFIRRRGELTIESDCHLLGLFPLETWSEIMRQAGFETHRVTSAYKLPTGESCYTMVGVKPI